eukprot:scaffold9951_cov146-Cylindrotheca_fusiformis.AAC.12
MGAQSSKIENADSRTCRAKHSQDDGISKSSGWTADSSLPSSPAVTVWSNTHTNSGTGPLRPRQQSRPFLRLDSLASDASRSAPVKCPQSEDDSAQYESDNARYLTRMYDNRTWEMYKRITEGRKKSSYASHCDSQPEPTQTENTSEWEHLQHDLVDTSSNGHEMIFLFDFD